MLAAGLGIFKDVHFIGFLSQRHLMELYAESHLFLHPSETPPDENQEGVPNSILEAMATGLPIVATQHGGIPEAVEHGRTGWLVPEEDHVALANAMQEITRSPRALAEMGLRARAAVAARFEQEAQIDQLESFYEEAIAMNAAAEPAKSKPMTQLAPQFAERVPAK
jgi:glycosyltransferase involved in cell wall biosynthesis